MWDVLLPTPYKCEYASTRNLKTKDLVIPTEYDGWQRITTNIRGPYSDLRRALGCLSCTIRSDTKCYLWHHERGCGFEIMLHRKTFISLSKCLYVEGYKILDIVSQPVGSLERLVTSPLPVQRSRPLDSCLLSTQTSLWSNLLFLSHLWWVCQRFGPMW